MSNDRQPMHLRIARATNDLQTIAAGFQAVSSSNPYWERAGRTFEDPEGYRVVLQNAQWP